ncbi:MAG: DUF1801 domain-containing protein [Bacteroidetes bacterium]|nr:DUF1801 domain-containing protein [Bacteroidota bacterium]
MQDVSSYIANAPEPERAVLNALNTCLSGLPGVFVKMNYGLPFYYRNSWICYLALLKNGGVELAFTRANELSNEQGLLDFRNRKQVAGIIFRELRDINLNVLHEVIQEAILLDDTVNYSVRKKK